eukprot:scaffold168307_cov22-Tisochrysis_lutea.AAC.1
MGLGAHFNCTVAYCMPLWSMPLWVTVETACHYGKPQPHAACHRGKPQLHAACHCGACPSG